MIVINSAGRIALDNEGHHDSFSKGNLKYTKFPNILIFWIQMDSFRLHSSGECNRNLVGKSILFNVIKWRG